MDMSTDLMKIEVQISTKKNSMPHNKTGSNYLYIIYTKDQMKRNSTLHHQWYYFAWHLQIYHISVPHLHADNICKGHENKYPVSGCAQYIHCQINDPLKSAHRQARRCTQFYKDTYASMHTPKSISYQLIMKIYTLFTRSTANTLPYFFLKSKKCRSATRDCIEFNMPSVKI